MNSRFVIFLIFCSLTIIAKNRIEAATNSSGGLDSTNTGAGCSINNGSVFVPANTTVADDTWWYLCTGESWLAKGCVVNGERYNVGDTFFGYLNEFYGRCEALEGKYIRATVLGCIDVNNKTIEPGHSYVADPLFWANCTSTKQIVSTPDLGNITLDIIGRKIVGCNDGSEDIIPNEGTFVQVTNDGPLLAGVGLVCKIQGSFPQVQPQVCVVANNSQTDEAYVGLADHCYGKLHKFVFYCTINGEEDLKNGTAVYGWEIGWNLSTVDFISYLKTNGFRDCINEPSHTPQTENITVSNLSGGRKKRENINFDTLEDENIITASRIKRSSASFPDSKYSMAYSKFTLMKKSEKLDTYAK